MSGAQKTPESFSKLVSEPNFRALLNDRVRKCVSSGWLWTGLQKELQLLCPEALRWSYLESTKRFELIVRALLDKEGNREMRFERAAVG